MKEPQKVGEIKPKSTVETACVEATAVQGILPFGKHKTFAFQARHSMHCDIPLSRCQHSGRSWLAVSFDPIQNHSDATGQQATSRNSEHKTGGTLVAADEVLKSALHHQHPQRGCRASQKPP